jgi:hypothetical protein
MYFSTYILMVLHQRLLKFHIIYNGFNLTVFDELSNYIEIA